jgi:GNAT superfamily N-acetyltransferase
LKAAGDPTPAIIRHAEVRDLEPIVEFNARLALETEDKILDRDVLIAGVRIALNEPDRLRYWVAELDQQVVGQAAITREWSDWRNGWLWWFQSVYVRAEYRGRGIFRALHQQIRVEALALPNVIGLRLYVDDENAAAQQTYQALGLVPGGYHVYEELWRDRFKRTDG